MRGGAVQVNMHEAKTHLSRLVERAAAGEEVILAKAGHPVARLVAIGGEKRARREPPAHLRGRVWMSDDFDDPLPELEARLYGDDGDDGGA